MSKKIIIALVVIIGSLVIFINKQPSSFKVARSAVIEAEAASVFSQVNNFHSWEQWSPWAKMDPNCKMTYEGPEAGVGASAAWAGNEKVGVGKMTITESKPNEFIKIRLDFEKPFKGTNTAEFTFTEDPSKQTKVTWSMYGKNNFISKAMSLLMNCDQMIGKNFETGLAQLKTLSENPPKQ